MATKIPHKKIVSSDTESSFPIKTTGKDSKRSYSVLLGTIESPDGKKYNICADVFDKKGRLITTGSIKDEELVKAADLMTKLLVDQHSRKWLEKHPKQPLARVTMVTKNGATFTTKETQSHDFNLSQTIRLNKEDLPTLTENCELKTAKDSWKLFERIILDSYQVDKKTGDLEPFSVRAEVKVEASKGPSPYLDVETSQKGKSSLEIEEEIPLDMPLESKTESKKERPEVSRKMHLETIQDKVETFDRFKGYYEQIIRDEKTLDELIDEVGQNDREVLEKIQEAYQDKVIEFTMKKEETKSILLREPSLKGMLKHHISCREQELKKDREILAKHRS
jgi:hypothetical protein